ncbi:alpha/beta fold hydrolase [Aestuariibius sp. HNIBRBA575]|uniref:alpha/beta fold hydrolase n=1 Tax=Aestuariibius sp. HNIBRBA575 TaxID=3233343 RepID=UPI0034A26A1C
METAPLFDDVADGPNGGAAHWLTTADGLRIRVGHWHVDNAKGTVLLFPGRTEYVEKYGRAAKELADRGYATVSIDWRGQGIAARMHNNPALGHVQQFTDYQHDVAAVLDHVRALNLPEPLFLLAHSMGGAIGLRAVMEGLPVKAAAFSAPMWGIGLSASLRPLAWAVSSLSKPLGFSNAIAPGQSEQTYVMRAPFDANSLTSDREMYDYMQSQLAAHPDLALGGPTLNWLNESLIETRDLAARPAPDLPCITFLGSDEDIVETGRIQSRMQNWNNGELVLIDKGRHEVMMETPSIRSQVFDQTAAHFDRFH